MAVSAAIRVEGFHMKTYFPYIGLAALALLPVFGFSSYVMHIAILVILWSVIGMAWNLLGGTVVRSLSATPRSSAWALIPPGCSIVSWAGRGGGASL
jgi:hypothetical protein